MFICFMSFSTLWRINKVHKVYFNRLKFQGKNKCFHYSICFLYWLLILYDNAATTTVSARNSECNRTPLYPVHKTKQCSQARNIWEQQCSPAASLWGKLCFLCIHQTCNIFIEKMSRDTVGTMLNIFMETEWTILFFNWKCIFMWQRTSWNNLSFFMSQFVFIR